jgi:hypothetical protein
MSSDKEFLKEHIKNNVITIPSLESTYDRMRFIKIMTDLSKMDTIALDLFWDDLLNEKALQ